MKRKEFIQLSASAVFLIANGRIAKANDYLIGASEKPHIALRFAVASDGHYGEPGTDYEKYFSSLVTSVNQHHSRKAFEFIMVNGDIIHNDKSHYPAAKKALDNFACKYYVSQGNHDMVTPEEWSDVWGMPLNYDFTHGRNAFLTGTTSNVKGEYVCPDLDWFAKKLDEHKNSDVYIFIHINPGALTENGIDCPELFEVLGKYKNIKAIFNGHDHDQDGIKTKYNIPFIFDSHFGGSWGTSYRGYRVVEIMKDGSALTYIMNPAEMMNKTKIG